MNCHLKGYISYMNYGAIRCNPLQVSYNGYAENVILIRV